MSTCKIHIISCLLLLAACGDNKRDAIGKTEVLIETTEGDIVLRLYDDTPLHRDNFIRNVEAHLYDDIPFHRIVPDMVIQAGDPSLRGKSAKGDRQEESTTEAAATIPSEIVYPRHFHKQGALAAAREPDSINPGRRSSALQWYIVTGKKQTSAQLAELQALLYEAKVAACFERLQGEHAAELTALKATDRQAHQELLSNLQIEAEEALAKNPPAPFTEVQKQTYARVTILLPRVFPPLSWICRKESHS